MARRPCAGRKIFLWQESPEPGERFICGKRVPSRVQVLIKLIIFLISLFSLLFSLFRFSALPFFLLLFPLFRFRLPVFFFPFFRSFVFAFLLPFLSFFLFVSVFSFVIFVSRYFSELVFILFLHCSSPFLPLFLSFVIGKRRAAKNGNDGQKKRSGGQKETKATGDKKRKRRAENGKKSDVKKIFPCYKM